MPKDQQVDDVPSQAVELAEDGSELPTGAQQSVSKKPKVQQPAYEPLPAFPNPPAGNQSVWRAPDPSANLASDDELRASSGSDSPTGNKGPALATPPKSE